MATFYFDGSDAAATDPDANWSSDANAFDGNIATFASGDISTTTTGFLKSEGTSAPTSGLSIISVKARVYGIVTSNNLTASIYTDGLGELLGEPVNASGGGGGWGSYVTLTTPSGGWTWAKVAALEVKIWVESSGVEQVSRVEVEVYSDPIPGRIYRIQGFQ